MIIRLVDRKRQRHAAVLEHFPGQFQTKQNWEDLRSGGYKLMVLIKLLNFFGQLLVTMQKPLIGGNLKLGT
jgi:hypothetical protein